MAAQVCTSDTIAEFITFRTIKESLVNSVIRKKLKLKGCYNAILGSQ